VTGACILWHGVESRIQYIDQEKISSLAFWSCHSTSALSPLTHIFASKPLQPPILLDGWDEFDGIFHIFDRVGQELDLPQAKRNRLVEWVVMVRASITADNVT
jgi:hypothetical protein